MFIRVFKLDPSNPAAVPILAKPSAANIPRKNPARPAPTAVIPPTMSFAFTFPAAIAEPANRIAPRTATPVIPACENAPKKLAINVFNDSPVTPKPAPIVANPSAAIIPIKNPARPAATADIPPTILSGDIPAAAVAAPAAKIAPRTATPVNPA